MKEETMKRSLLIAGWLYVALFRNAALADYSPEYEDLNGARFRNDETCTWDVAWSEDIHGKKFWAPMRCGPRADSPAGDNVSLGRYHYALYAASKVDLYVYGLETKASKVEFWLSVEDEAITDRGVVNVNGKGDYKVTLGLKKKVQGVRPYLKASCSQPLKLSWNNLVLMPEYIYPAGIEGMHMKTWFVDPGQGKVVYRFPVKIIKGKVNLGLPDFDVNGKGIRMPRLGVGVDIALCDRASNDYRTRVFADNGDVILSTTRGRVLRTIGPKDLVGTKFFLNSRKLDSDGDGYWSADVLREIDPMGLEPGLHYTTIIPATWFDVPAPGQGAGTYKTLKFEYLSSDGRKQAVIPLRQDTFNADGSVRIGFVHWCSSCKKAMSGCKSKHRVYVVQSNRGGGVIIGWIESLADFRCAQIVKGTLRVSPEGEGIHPRFGKQISYYQMATFYGYPAHSTEFDIYHYSRLCNTLTMRVERSWRYPPKLVWDDAYVRMKTAEHVGHWQRIVDTCKRYGIDCHYEIRSWDIPDFTVLNPDCVAESYDRKTGALVKSTISPENCRRMVRPLLDVANPVSRKRMEDYWAEFYRHFERLPRVEVVEVAAKGGRQKEIIKIGEDEYRYGGDFYSAAALESYRQYVGDPPARFPVAPGDKETERTFCTTDRAAWENYKNWIIDAYTDGAVLVMARGARRAFRNNPSYLGMAYMEGAVGLYEQGDLLDMRKMIRDPGITMWINEHGYYKTESHGITREVFSLARENKMKFIILMNLIRLISPGDIIPVHRGGVNSHIPKAYEECFWLCDRLTYRLFPEIDGIAWHADFTEDFERFWVAYQTAVWDRGLMPLSEAQEIMKDVRNTYEEHKADFEYDPEHQYSTVWIKRYKKDFDIFAPDAGSLVVDEMPLNNLKGAEHLFRGREQGDRLDGFFRVAAAGDDKLSFFVEVADQSYTGLGTDEYTSPIGEAWAWKDKVDIYLGYSQINWMWVIGNGLGPGRYQHRIPRNVIWIEARCGEEEVACYYRKRMEKKGPFAYGKAQWEHLEDEGKWRGRIEINLGNIQDGLTVENLTGFNFGVQDVDEGEENVRYLLYETYPRWVNGIARYANIKLVE